MFLADEASLLFIIITLPWVYGGDESVLLDF